MDNKIKLDNILENDAFKAIEPEKIQALKSLVQDIEGKDMMSAMPIIMGFMGEMQKGKPVTQQQRKDMMDVIVDNLSDSDRVKLMEVMKMMGTT